MKSLYIFEKSGEIIANLIFFALFLFLFKFILNFIITDEVDHPIYFGTAFMFFLIFEIRKYCVWLRQNKNKYVNPKE